MLATLKILWNSLKMALQELRVNKVRTFLSLLGITIGIFCIIAVFAATESLENNVRKEVASLGSNVIYIQKWPWGGGPDMPWWKYVSNRFLTWVENRAFGLNLSEFHTGYRAYTAEALQSMNLATNSDKFIFDQEVVAQAVTLGLKITEIAVPTRYFPQASSASFLQSSRYGLSILYLVMKYGLHKSGIRRSRQFESLSRRYRIEKRAGLSRAV